MATFPLFESQTDPIAPESQPFLMKMAGLMPGIIYVFNQQTMSNEYTNRSVASLLGYSPEEVLEMGEQLMPIIMYDEDLSNMPAHFAALSDLGPGEHAVFEYRVRAKDGRRVWLRSVDTVFDRASDGTVLRHLGIAFDISAEKEAQEELSAANAELEARVLERTAELLALNRELESRVESRTSELNGMNEELKQLTHVATHDLKVPINNLCSLTHMLSDAEPLLTEEHVETLGWMRQVSAQAKDKLDALIWVAQLQDSELAPLTEIDMAQLTEAALVSLHFDMRQARAVVTSDFSAVRYIRCLPQEFENMMESLVSNALKYTHPDRRPRVELRSHLDANSVAITVTDNGSGLNLPGDEAKVFGLFQRAHTTPEGSGVALYTMRRIMEKLGGKITVQNNADHGCTFTLRFPKALKVNT